MDDISSWGIRSPGHLLDFLLLPWIGAEAQVVFKDVWLPSSSDFEAPKREALGRVGR